jgi:ribonucleoside-diphosphate reductase alpha chain
VAHETVKDDILEAQGVKPVSEAQLSLINGAGVREDDRAFVSQADAPPCPDCGSIMVRRGACYSCLNCGATSGCA